MIYRDENDVSIWRLHRPRPLSKRNRVYIARVHKDENYHDLGGDMGSARQKHTVCNLTQIIRFCLITMPDQLQYRTFGKTSNITTCVLQQ
jgi:hypothetical protein